MRERLTNVAQISGAVTCRNIHAATQGDSEMGKIAADALSLSHCLRCGARRFRLHVVEADNLAISRAVVCLVDFCSCLIGSFFADQSPSFAARVFDNPSVSVSVTRRVRAAGVRGAFKFGLDGMPSFSATWIGKSCGTVGRVLPVIGGTTCVKLRPQEHVPSGGSRRGTCHRPAPPRCRFVRVPEPHPAAPVGSSKNPVPLCYSAARV